MSSGLVEVQSSKHHIGQRDDDKTLAMRPVHELHDHIIIRAIGSVDLNSEATSGYTVRNDLWPTSAWTR